MTYRVHTTKDCLSSVYSSFASARGLCRFRRVNPPEATHHQLAQPRRDSDVRLAKQGRDRHGEATTFVNFQDQHLSSCCCYCTAPSSRTTGQDLPFHRNNIRDISHQMMPKKPTRATPKVLFHISWSGRDGGRGQCPTIQRLRGLPPLS